MNDLKMKSMAKYKCIKDGDLVMYKELEDELVDMPAVKGRAFDDSSMEEMEREIISDLSKRGLNNPEMNFGRKSDNSEALFSAHSSKDFFDEKIEKRK